MPCLREGTLAVAIREYIAIRAESYVRVVELSVFRPTLTLIVQTKRDSAFSV
jgi:hypothetical protein